MEVILDTHLLHLKVFSYWHLVMCC